MDPFTAVRPLYADVLETTPLNRRSPSAFDTPALFAWAWQQSPAVAILYRFAAVQIIEQLSGARRRGAALRNAPAIFLRNR